MSLIPSESHSFPDNYSPVARSRRSQKRQLSPSHSEQPLEGNVVLLPAAAMEPNVISSSPVKRVDEQFFRALEKMAERNAAPSPMEPLQSSSLPTPIKRVPRASIAPPLSAASVDEASLLTANGHGRASQYRPRTPVRATQSSPANESISTQSAIETPLTSSSFVEQPNNEFDFTDLSSDVERRARRSKKFVRFIMIELFALSILIPSAWLVLSRNVTNPTLVILLNILTITAAAIMAIVPIISYAIAPGFSRRDR